MIIGIDLDNTIVCYDSAIEKFSSDIKGLPKNLPRSKLSIRNFLRTANREPEWTEFQGMLYGPGMSEAEPFPNSIEILDQLVRDGCQIYIVSHRTRLPYLGPLYDLHASALTWIERNLIATNLISHDRVFLRETRQEKLIKISELNCTAFIDDLPEVLLDPYFPHKSCKGVLFDPGKTHSKLNFLSVKEWAEIPAIVRSR